MTNKGTCSTVHQKGHLRIHSAVGLLPLLWSAGTPALIWPSRMLVIYPAIAWASASAAAKKEEGAETGLEQHSNLSWKHV